MQQYYIVGAVFISILHVRKLRHREGEYLPKVKVPDHSTSKQKLFAIHIREIKELYREENAQVNDIEVSKHGTQATVFIKPVDWMLVEKWQEIWPEQSIQNTAYAVLRRHLYFLRLGELPEFSVEQYYNQVYDLEILCRKDQVWRSFWNMYLGSGWIPGFLIWMIKGSITYKKESRKKSWKRF